MARSKVSKKSKRLTKAGGKQGTKNLHVADVKDAAPATGTGRRLTPQQRHDIMIAEGSLKEIAEQFGTTINTVSRYRKGLGGATRGRGRRSFDAGSSKLDKGKMQVSSEGDYIVVRIPKSGLMKQVIGSMFV